MQEKEMSADQLDKVGDAPKKENKFKKFVLKHKYYAGLILLILIILLWSFIKIALLQNNFKAEKEQIITSYVLKLDSLNSERLILTAKTFSWAIRSELIRENKDQINQFFNEFVKNPDIIKLQLINPETSVVELSSDKKDEGTIISGLNLIEKQIIKKDSTGFYIITPISGLNKKIGVFVMQVRNTSDR